jgi:hypothetical protein
VPLLIKARNAYWHARKRMTDAGIRAARKRGGQAQHLSKNSASTIAASFSKTAIQPVSDSGGPISSVYKLSFIPIAVFVFLGSRLQMGQGRLGNTRIQIPERRHLEYLYIVLPTHAKSL